MLERYYRDLLDFLARRVDDRDTVAGAAHPQPQRLDRPMNPPRSPRPGWRRRWALAHRYLGLIAAPFLFVTGLSGAVISWDHELDELLNPQLTEARASGAPRPRLELACELEARYPQVRVTFVPLAAEPGHALAFGVQPRVDPATGRLAQPGFNQVFVDPASGEELGKREWGAVWPISRENFVSFLYKLHFSLHLPEIGGIDRWGVWLLGIIAIGWTLDCFVGFYLTLPARRRAGRRADEAAEEGADPEGDDQTGDAAPAPAGRRFWQRWKPAWKVRRQAGPYKLNYDLHRAASLWTWLLLFIVALTAFSLNLRREVFFPLMSAVSQVTPTPFDVREPQPLHAPLAPALGFAEIIDRAAAEAARRGWSEPAGSAFYAQRFGIYGVQFFRPEADHGASGVGHKRLYYDGKDGQLLGERLPWHGSAADIFVQAQFPLHSGRILALPGRVLISVMGLVVALLSVTGVYVWWKKRAARRKAARRQAPPAVAAPLTSGR